MGDRYRVFDILKGMPVCGHGHRGAPDVLNLERRVKCLVRPSGGGWAEHEPAAKWSAL